MTNPNHSAYPALEFHDGRAIGSSEGLTKREFFTVMALQGLLSADAELDCSLDDYTKRIAKVSVMYADALIEALNNNEKTAGQ